MSTLAAANSAGVRIAESGVLIEVRVDIRASSMGVLRAVCYSGGDRVNILAHV
jgi:hypothetical protein